MSKKIVILGAGTGGLVIANKLRKALPVEDEIIVIDKEKNHIFNPSLLWLMVGWRSSKQIQKPLSLLERKGIKFLNAEISGIDFENRTVFTSEDNISYDYLVIALGAGTFPDRLEGFSGAACNIYDLSGVERLKEELDNYDKGRLVILISSLPFKCPAAPYEASLILSEYFARKKKNIEIEVVTPEVLPMTVAGQEIGNMVVSMLKSRGIRFTPKHQVIRIDPERKEISFNEDKTLSYDFLVGIPPHGVPEVMKGSPILGENGWVNVNTNTLETEIENVYALGDVTSIMLPLGKPLPKAGVFAHLQADVVAHNIISKINGQPAVKKFNGEGYCFIELGNGKAGYASGNFYTNPKPVVKIKKPSRLFHLGKVLFEKWWLWKWF